MALSKNKAVREAYASSEYTDAKGFSWYRGMDGWFLRNEDPASPIMLARHDDMVAMIEKEHPDE